MTLRIRVETAADRDAIADVTRAAFGRGTEMPMVAAIRGRVAFPPSYAAG